MTDVKKRLEAGEHISIADISAADREALGIPTSFDMSQITSDPFMELTPWTDADIERLDTALAEIFNWRKNPSF